MRSLLERRISSLFHEKKTDQCLLFFAEEKKFRVNFAKETFLKTDTARPEILFATDRKIF